MKTIIFNTKDTQIVIRPYSGIDEPQVIYVDKQNTRRRIDKAYYKSQALGSTTYYYLIESNHKFISHREKRIEIINALDSYYRLKHRGHKLTHSMTPSLHIKPNYRVKFTRFG